MRSGVLLLEVKTEHAAASRDDVMRSLLEDIRLRTDEDRCPADQDRAYAEAFAEYGVAIDTLGADVAAAELRASRLREELIDGLDDWARWRGRASGVSK